MAHMQKQEYSGVYYEVETNEGISFVPAEVCGVVDGLTHGETWYWDSAETESESQVWQAACDQLRNYVQGKKFVSIGAAKGKLYRLSAPGYLDCTDWTTDANSPEFDDAE